MNSSRRTLTATLIIAAAAWLLLVGAIQWGLRTPRREVLGVSSQAPALDYSAFSGFFTPLSAEYIAKILGLDLGGRSLLAGRSGTPRAGSLGSSGGRLDITHPFTNDHFADAYVIPSVPFTARTNASGATRESGEPIDCSPVGGTVWYRFRPAHDVGLIANTIGTGYTTALGVFTGDRLGNLEEHRCDLDAAGNALVTFSAQAGIDYYFQISGPAGMGPLVFNLSPLGSTSAVGRGTSGTIWGNTGNASISADGRFLAFDSPGGGDGCERYEPHQTGLFRFCITDVFVRDLETGTTTRVSVSSTGEPGNRSGPLDRGPPDISADGRFVAFQSDADNLVAGDTNDYGDIFVHDRATGRTERVSVSSSGEEGTAPPRGLCFRTFERDPTSCPTRGARVSISADGRFVAFDSDFPNLHPDDPNSDGWSVFVRDRPKGTTELISSQGAGRAPSISADGRYVAYAVEGHPSEPRGMVLVHDRLTGAKERVSVSSSGQEPNRISFFVRPSISADGRYVAFYHEASNLVPGDTNDIGDFFVRDRLRRTTTRVSVSSSGEQQADAAEVYVGVSVDISADGRFVAFSSNASNLVPDDTNRAEDVFVHDLLTRTTTRVSVSSSGEEAHSKTGAKPESKFPTISAFGHVAFSSTGNGLDPEADERCWACQLVYLHQFPIF